MIALTIVLAVLVGISLGLLGGGGSILTVPLLAYVAGMDAKPAIATSLLVVGVTSAIGAITHARAGRVRWRVAALFGASAMAGAYAGGLLARFIPGTALLIAFAAIMIAAGVAMLRGRKDTTADRNQHLKVLQDRAAGRRHRRDQRTGRRRRRLPTGPRPRAAGRAADAGRRGHLAGRHIDAVLRRLRRTPGHRAHRLAAGRPGHRRRGPRRLDRRPPHRVRRPELAAQTVRMVRPADGISHAGRRSPPRRRRRRRRTDPDAAGMSIACTRYAHCPLRRLLRRSQVSAVG